LLKIKKSKWIQVCLGLSCIFIMFITNIIHIPFVSSMIEELDARIYDQIIKLNWQHHQISPDVVIIDIDDKSVQKEGRWPWPRDKMADLIKKLKQYGVVTIGLDIVMSEAEINYALDLKNELMHLIPNPTVEQKQLPLLLDKIAPQVDNDQIFAHSLPGNNVILGYLFQDDPDIKEGVLPQPLTDSSGAFLNGTKLSMTQFSGYNGCLELFLKSAANAGFVSNIPDLDGTIRHDLVVAKYQNKVYPGLPLAVVMNYMLADHASLKIRNQKLYGLQIKGLFVPLNYHGQLLIPFWGKPETLSYYSATDIIRGKIPSDELQGAIAIIGSSMILLADLHQTPVAQLFPGSEMVGNVVQAILGQQLVMPYDWHSIQGKLGFILFGVLIAILFSLLGVVVMLLVTIITIFLILAFCTYLFVTLKLFVAPSLLLLLVVLLLLVNYSYLFILERQQRRKINQLFGQYVPEAYVKELMELPAPYGMEGQVRHMTVFFSDIRNFTSISETLDAVDVKHLLNAFFTPITEIIFSFRGTIDKYVGDMIVAFWGAPIQDEEHAYHAIMTALTVVNKLPEINQRLLENKLPALSIGIGLASGLMNVGDMGSEFRRAYTVLGDTVNLASRLQDLTRFYNVDILVNDVSRQQQEQFVWRAVDKIIVKGRKTGLTIYQPLGKVQDVSEDVILELEEYNKALDDYYAQKWSSAEKKFEFLKNKFSGIYLYQLYLDRIKVFRETPPPEDWDGVYIHLSKY